MKRRTFLQVLGTGVAGMMLPNSCGHVLETERPPNILVILSDDQGWNQLGCYGSEYYEAPHIDRLAEQGMRFTNAYAAAPVCSPTRASLMTGKYPARLHLTNYIPGGSQDINSKLLGPDWTRYLPLEETTIAEALKEKKYNSAHFGKWHLSTQKKPPESLPHNPDKQGFDEVFVTYKPSGKLKEEWQTPENDPHNVEHLTRKALAFLEEYKDERFFLCVSHNSIHTPLMERDELISKYANKAGADTPENNPVIGAMLEELDRSVGVILNKLNELEIQKNTLVMFLSDNGGLDEKHGEVIADQAPLRGGKADLYEGGIRVPFIARWPGKIPAGTERSDLVASIDLYPTILQACGIEDSDPDVDGKSLLPVLLANGTLERNILYWHFPHYHSSGEGPSGAIRLGRYKLIEWFERSLIEKSDAVELFNLEEDIGETTNLADKMPEKTSELLAKLTSWRNSVHAQMPQINANYSSNR